MGWGAAFAGTNLDIAFFLDIPVDIAIERRIARGEHFQSVDEERQFYSQVRDEYARLVESGNWMVIDGTRSIEEVHREITKVVLAQIR